MKITKKTVLVAIMFVCLVASVFANGTNESGAKKLTLKATTSQGEQNVSAEMDYLKHLKSELEKRTNGEVCVDIYPNEQLGGQNEMAQGIQAGTIDIAVFNYSILNSFYPETMLPTCPGVFLNAEEADKILNGSYGQELHKRLEEATGIKILSTITQGFRCFTSSKPLSTIESAKGQTFRCMQNELSVAMVGAIGANAVPMASSEMYTAMQNGTVDGQENPVINIINDKTYEVQKYLTLDNHMASISAFTISKKTFDKLTSEQQQILLDIVKECNPIAEKVFAQINTEGIKTLENYGMTVYQPTEAELIAWQTPISKACDKLVRQKCGDAAVDALQKAVAADRK